MPKSSDQRRRLRVARNKRKKIALILAASILLVLTTCAKVLVRTGFNPQADEKTQASRPEITLDQWESIGMVAGRTLVAPLPNPIAAERHRDFQRLARALKRRKPQNSDSTIDDEDQPKVAIVARKPFVLYVAITALVQFVLGFICAMQIGYQPVLFGRRISLVALDPFPGIARGISSRTDH